MTKPDFSIGEYIRCIDLVYARPHERYSKVVGYKDVDTNLAKYVLCSTNSNKYCLLINYVDKYYVLATEKEFKRARVKALIT